MVELCNIFSSDSPHRNCCFDKVAFSEEACVVTRNFIEGKKLVGKIDEEESGAKGNVLWFRDIKYQISIEFNQQEIKYLTEDN